MGVRTFKVDSPSGQQGGLSNGLPSNNLFDLLAAKSEYENMESYTGERPCMMMRSGYAGSQRYPLVWSSDQYNADDNDLRYQMMAQQNIGLSGNAFWANDIGTWQGAKMTPGRYARWAEYGLMAGVVPSLCSSHYTPWYFGSDIEDIFRKYDLLRSRMIPYIYTYAKKASETGVPIMRSMLLECQDDKNVYNMWDEWFFGNELLVAPVTNDKDNSRDIYLPEGRWIDWWNDKEYVGPQTIKAYDAPLDKMPIFVKAGAIIPMGPEKQYFDGVVTNPLTLRIFPSGKSSFTLYEDNGVDLKYKSGEYARSNIECSGSSGVTNVKISKPVGYFTIPDRDIYLEVNMMKDPSTVCDGETKLGKCKTIAELKSAEEGWYYDISGSNGLPGICYAKLKYTGDDINVSLRNR
jgi:alpha-glucosidase (family GH31 glycosyl hydrolase)